MVPAGAHFAVVDERSGPSGRRGVDEAVAVGALARRAARPVAVPARVHLLQHASRLGANSAKLGAGVTGVTSVLQGYLAHGVRGGVHQGGAVGEIKKRKRSKRVSNKGGGDRVGDL